MAIEINTHNRIVELDYIRVFLAFLIFLFHSRIHVSCNYGLLNAFVETGHIVGMTAFFMLSGYALVISNGFRDFTAFDEIKRFYKKRFISIFPLYIVAGTLGVFIEIIAKTQTVQDNLILLPIEVLCFQSFYNSLFSFAHNGGTWFISCLVFCYALFPLFNTILKFLNKKTLLFILLIFIFILSYSPFLTRHFAISDNYSNPFFRLLEFSVGMMLARINMDSVFEARILDFMRNKWSLVAGIVLLFVGISFSRKYGVYNDWMPICLFTIILIGAGHIRLPSCFNNCIVKYLSAISYAFYLGQLLVWKPAKIIIEHYLPSPNNYFLMLTTFLACFFAAIVLHELVEKPIGKRLRIRLRVS